MLAGSGWLIIIIIIIVYIIIIILLLVSFHSCISWWSFTGVWVKVSLLKSPPISYSSNPLSKPLETVPRMPITIGITGTVKFSGKVQILVSYFFLFSFIFIL